MKLTLSIAAAHYSVSGNITRNAQFIESQMKEAAENCVQLIHFPVEVMGSSLPLTHS